MFIHADKNLKGNLLNMYKKDAEEHALKKQGLKIRQLQEDRVNLETSTKKYEEELMRKQSDKQKKTEEAMNDYKYIVEMREEKKRRGKNNPSEESNFYNYNFQNVDSSKTRSPQDQEVIESYREKEFEPNKQEYSSPKINNINSIMFDFKVPTDFTVHRKRVGYNHNYVHNIAKMEVQKSYKDYLDSQVI